MVGKSSKQFGTLLLNRYYLFNSFFATLSTPLLTLASLCLYLFPTPMKINQYLLSFISVNEFFANNGVSNSSTNCDSALSFPIDTLEAILTTVLFVIAVPPIIFMFSQVLYPWPFDSDLSHSYAIVNDSERQADSYWNKAGLGWRVLTAWTSVDWFSLKGLFNFAWRLQHHLQAFISIIEESFDAEREGKVKQELKKFSRVRCQYSHFIGLFFYYSLQAGIRRPSTRQRGAEYGLAACMGVRLSGF